MSISYNDLSIRGRNGKRVLVTDCNLEPLNLLIPGGAPILVPKKKAWRPPHPGATINKDAEYDAEAEDDEVRIKSRSRSTRRKEQKARGAAAEPRRRSDRCRKNSVVKEKAREARHRRAAERHQARAERELGEADEKRRGLQRRVEQQEAYIAKLKARYEARAGGGDGKKKVKGKAEEFTAAEKTGQKRHARVEDSSSGDDDDTSADEASGTTDKEDATTDASASTDASAKVREMLRHMKIRAGGGNDGGGAFASHDGGPFTASEDAQLLLHKNNGETWAFIKDAMKRGKSELQKRFKELKASGATIPGGDVQDDDAGGKAADDKAAGEDTTDAEKTGEETTDAEKTCDETTDAEKTEDENKDGEDGDTFPSNLMDTLEAVVEKEAAKKGGKKNKKQQQQQKKCSPSNSNDNINNANNTNGGGGDLATGYDADEDENIGTKRYLASYAQRVAEADEGGARAAVVVPEADGYFDEDDCLLLALADGHRRRNRWMEIQADFANVTGRLVPEAVLRWKLGGDKRPEGY